MSVCGVCFLCSHVFTEGFSWWVWVRGCFLVENRGASSMEADTLSGSRSTPFERFGSHVAASFFVALFLWGVWGWWCVWWVVCDLYSGCEHLYFLVVWFCLVLLGIRWMPWHQELMKDVAACDMPRGVGERALIRGCPNGGT